jgi:hypothetical protein
MMLLPQVAPYTAPLEVLICGGTTAEPVNAALDNCVSLKPDVPGAQWSIERMVCVITSSMIFASRLIPGTICSLRAVWFRAWWPSLTAGF